MADEDNLALPPSEPPVSPFLPSSDERNENSEEESARSPTPPSSQLDPSVVENSNSTMQSEIAELADSKQASDERSSDEWIDVLGSGELLKKVINTGDGASTRPGPQGRVTMRMRGTLPSGKNVDRHSSASFIVGDGDVVQAIDLVASLMERGEVCKVKTTSRFAYGASGRPQSGIPPNTSLLYELELLEVQEPIDFSTITESELILYLHTKRGRGNDLFQRREYQPSISSYSRAVQMLRSYKKEQGIDKLSAELQDQWIRCLNNLAAAQIKVELYTEVLESTQEVLSVDPNNVKAHYRAGKVSLIKEEFDDAIHHLRRAAELSPEEKAIKAELEKALRKRDRQKVKETEMCQRMMGVKGNSPVRRTHLSSSPTATGWAGRSLKMLLYGAGLAAVMGIAWWYIMRTRK